jgi:glycosyltransferase involved in cell wall biosynthesis
MINIAFIKYGGMASGGIEKYLQTLAVNLPKDKFNVDYFYTNLGNRMYSNFKHPDNDEGRLQYMKDNGMNVIKVDIESMDCRFHTNFVWHNSNFWDLFKEDKYDIVQTGRFGYKEYPFYEMKNSKIVDSIHSCGQCVIDHGPQIKKTVLLSTYQANLWVKAGGDFSKIKIIPPVIDDPKDVKIYDLRERLGISKDTVVCGMHQRVDDNIFSPIPLESFRNVGKDAVYLIMGGSDKYKQQAQGLSNVRFVDFSSDPSDIYSFLSSLDFYLHGRQDGEVCSASIIEALKHGLPVLSHSSRLNNGHEEQIRGCGFFATDVNSYSTYMKHLINPESDLLRDLSTNALAKYHSTYSLDSTIDEYVNLYEEVHELH